MPFESGLRGGVEPHPGARGLLAGREAARDAVRLRAERLDVAVHRAEIAVAHLRRVPPGHRRLAVAPVRRLQRLDPALLAHALRDGAQVLPVRRAPRAAKADV